VENHVDVFHCQQKAFLIPYIVSLPFFGLELFVGFVQALVFMMLTLAFFVVAISGHGGEGH